MNRKHPDESNLPALSDSQPLSQPFAEDAYLEFSGRKMVSVPGDLLFDQVLNDGEKVFWGVLRHECMDGNKQMPDQAYLADRLNKSRTSVILYIKMLRATRWLSVSRGARIGNLPTRQTYIIHERQISFGEAVRFDDRYIDFILEEATQSKNRRLRQECRNITLQLEQENYPFSSEQTFNKRQIIIEHTPSAVQLLNSGEISSVQKLNSGETIRTQKTFNESISAVQNLDSEQSSGVQKLDSGEKIAVQKLDTEERPVVQNLDSDTNPDVQLLNTGEDIYNHARSAHAVDIHTRAPTHRRNIISCGNNINPTTNLRDGGSGGRDENPFAWFTQPPLSILVEKVESRYGKKTAHSVINRLKLGTYCWKEENFRYQHDAEDAAIVLFSLLDEEVKVPVAFVDALLCKAYKGELCWRGDQYQRYCDMTSQNANPQHSPRTNHQRLQDIPDGTVLIGQSGQRYMVMDNAIEPTTDITLDGELLEKYIRAKRQDGLGAASAIADLNEIHFALASGKLRFADGGGE